jgi:hypothetical protein
MDTTQGTRADRPGGSLRIRPELEIRRSGTRFSTLFPNRGPARRAADPATWVIERAFYGQTSACTPIRFIRGDPGSKVPPAAHG